MGGGIIECAHCGKLVKECICKQPMPPLHEELPENFCVKKSIRHKLNNSEIRRRRKEKGLE